MTALDDLSIPVLMRRIQVEQMLKTSLPHPLSEWVFRKYIEGKNKQYFLKPSAFYILKKKRNSLYSEKNVKDFVKWYLHNINEKKG